MDILSYAGNGEFLGSISGVAASSTLDKIWLVFEALGDVAFAFPYSVIVLEIQVGVSNLFFSFQFGEKNLTYGVIIFWALEY